MRRTIAMALVPMAILFGGCGAQGNASVDRNGRVESQHHDLWGHIQKVTVDGTECIIWQGKDSRGGATISCDWSDNDNQDEASNQSSLD